MKFWRFLAVVLILPILFALPHAFSQNADEDTGEGSRSPGIKGTCLPAFMAGLLAGSSTDFELVQLYGKGVFRTDPYPVRYYSDVSGNTGLRVRWFTDWMITEIRLQQGIIVPTDLDEGEKKNLVSEFFDSRKPHGYYRLRLGCSRNEVQGLMGKPHQIAENPEAKTLIWSYNSDCACELPAGVTFEFRGDELVAIECWNPPG